MSHCVGGFLARTIPPDDQTPGMWQRFVIVPLWLPLLICLYLPLRALPLAWRQWQKWAAARPQRKRGFEAVIATVAQPSSENR